MQTLCLESDLQTVPNWWKIWKMTVTSQFSDRRHQIFLRFLFLLSSLVTGPSFMSISSLVLELWNFGNFFIRDWPEIRNTEKPTSEFCPVSGDWNQLWIPNLARMSLIECYWMLQNSRVIAFSVFELLRENQLGGGNQLTGFYMKVTLTLNGLIGHLPFINKNNLTLAEVIGRSVTKTFMSVLMVDSYTLHLITF